MHRIGMVLCGPFPAARGTQAYVSELSAALVVAGHEVHVWCYGDGLAGGSPAGVVVHRAAQLRGLGLGRVGAVSGSAPSVARPVQDALVLRQLVRDLSEVRPDVLHGHNHEGAVVAALGARRARVPFVYQAHSALGEELPAWSPRGLRRVASAIGGAADRLVPRAADWVLTLDERAARWMRARVTSPVTALPPGVVPPTDPAQARDREVGYLGNLDPYQDLPLLLRAMERVPRARLVIVTHDPTPSLRGAEFRRVGSFEDAMAETRKLPFTVVPRIACGGYPVKLLNSLAAGVPVVATRGAAKGLDEAAGVVAVAPNPEALGAAIDALLADPERRQRLAQAAHRFALRHPWSAVADTCAGVYDSLLS